MSSDHWPLFGLRVRTPRVELRYPDDGLVAQLAALAADGIHDPAFMPFSVPWTRQDPDVLRREYGRHVWAGRAALLPSDWKLHLAVLADGEVVGVQDLFATDFAVTRVAHTGSWLGRRHQGRGIGTEMRAAVLHLAFDALGAQLAETGCWEDNPRSAAVTRKLGYTATGGTIGDREGTAVRMLHFQLPRSEWEARRRDDIVIEGLEPCLPMLGLSSGP